MKLLSLCSNPLFSTIIAFYSLILIYAPSFFIIFALSPVFNTTGVILLFVLKLGANERSSKQTSIHEELRILDSSANERMEKESSNLEPRVLAQKDNDYERVPSDGSNLSSYSHLDLESSYIEPKVLEVVDQNHAHAGFEAKIDVGLESNQTHVEVEHDLSSDSNFQDNIDKWELLDANSEESSHVVEEGDKRMEMHPKQIDTTMKILEWNMKAPLEIIYEAYEGEEDEYEEGNVNNLVCNDKETVRCERYPSLLMYYSESETGSSSDGDFPMNANWETHESAFFRWEEEEDDREELIEISLDSHEKKSIVFSHNDEENLIEIDISSKRD